MKIYEIWPDFTYAKFTVDDEFFPYFDIRGNRITEWPRIEITLEEYAKEFEIGDLTFVALTPLVSENAVEKLNLKDKKNVQLLPVYIKENQKKYYVLNICNMIDCLDRDASYIRYSSSGKTVVQIRKHVFFEDKLKGEELFIIPDRRDYFFITDQLKEKMDKAGLTGTGGLKLVWDSEAEQEKQINETVKTSQEDTREDYFAYVGELEDDVKQEVKEAYEKGIQAFRIKNVSDPKNMAYEIHDIIDKILETGEIPDSYTNMGDVAIDLGVMFGQCLCNGLGWIWKEVGETRESVTYAVVSPNKNDCVPPIYVVNRILKKEHIGLDGENHNVIALYYNMFSSTKRGPHRVKYFLYI